MKLADKSIHFDRLKHLLRRCRSRPQRRNGDSVSYLGNSRSRKYYWWLITHNSLSFCSLIENILLHRQRHLKTKYRSKRLLHRPDMHQNLRKKTEHIKQPQLKKCRTRRLLHKVYSFLCLNKIQCHSLWIVSTNFISLFKEI